MIIEAQEATAENNSIPNPAAKNDTVGFVGGIRLHRSNPYGLYEVDVFSEEAFARNQAGLTELVIDFARIGMGWSGATAREVYSKALSVRDLSDESTYPSVMVFRKEGVVAGVSAQRLKYITTYVAGMVPVEYHILRGFNPLFQGQGMGRDSIELSRLVHRRAIYYAARNGSPIPVWATMQANQEGNLFVPGSLHPWERFYDTDPKVDRVFQEIMGQLHMDISTGGKWPNGSTGVSIGDYPEYNRSYTPRSKHTPTEGLLRRMEGRRMRNGELAMNIKRGDSVITVAKFA